MNHLREGELVRREENQRDYKKIQIQSQIDSFKIQKLQIKSEHIQIKTPKLINGGVN